MKKILVALLLLIAMVANCVMLASCDMFGGSNDGEDEEWNNEVVEGKINITFYHTMGENLRTVLNAYLEDFEAMYPNIHVIHEPVGGYDDVRSQISTELTVGGGPNLAYCYPDHVALYNVAKAVVTLDEFINGGKATTDAGKLADGTVADLGLTEEQSIYLEDYGHIGQIDQILSLERALKEGKVKEGSTVCMIAAGIGYTWAANIIKWG